MVTAIGSAVLIGLATGIWNETPVLFALIIDGTSAGFLPHNFPKARMFMGDVSSAPLGYSLAFLCLWLSAGNRSRYYLNLTDRRRHERDELCESLGRPFTQPWTRGTRPSRNSSLPELVSIEWDEYIRLFSSGLQFPLHFGL